MMSKVTISLPDSVRGFILEKVQKDGYGTVSEYIRELVRSDQKADIARSEKSRRLERGTGGVWNGSRADIYEHYEY